MAIDMACVASRQNWKGCTEISDEVLEEETTILHQGEERLMEQEFKTEGGIVASNSLSMAAIPPPTLWSIRAATPMHAISW